MNNFAMTNSSTAAAPITMSSREIAELTGKAHQDVLRDVRNLLDELGAVASSFAGNYIAANGKANPMFNLPHRETMILLTGYSVPMRAKVVDRWTELEAQATKPAFQIPQTMGQALALAAQQWEMAEMATAKAALLTAMHICK